MVGCTSIHTKPVDIPHYVIVSLISLQVRQTCMTSLLYLHLRSHKHIELCNMGNNNLGITTEFMAHYSIRNFMGYILYNYLIFKLFYILDYY